MMAHTLYTIYRSFGECAGLIRWTKYAVCCSLVMTLASILGKHLIGKYERPIHTESQHETERNFEDQSDKISKVLV